MTSSSMRPFGAAVVLIVVSISSPSISGTGGLRLDSSSGVHEHAARSCVDISPPQLQEALAETPTLPDCASVYIFQPKRIITSGLSILSLDGHGWAALGGGDFILALVRPGRHTVSEEKCKPSELNLEAGRTYFFSEYCNKVGGSSSPIGQLLHSGGSVKAVSTEVGTENIQKSKFNDSNWFLHKYVSNWSVVREGMTVAEVSNLIYLPRITRRVSETGIESTSIEKENVADVLTYDERDDVLTSYTSALFCYSVEFRGGVLLSKRNWRCWAQ